MIQPAGQARGTARGRAARLAALLAALAMLPGAAATGSGVPPPALVHVTAFDDGALSQTVAVDGCTDTDGEVAFDLRLGAEVDDASLRVRLSDSGRIPEADIGIDVGADGVPEAGVSLMSGTAQVVRLGPAAFNTYLALHRDGEGRVPVRVTACGPAPDAVVVLDQVDITQWSSGFVHAPPTIVKDPPSFDLLAGTSDPDALDLAGYFGEPNGGPLRFGVVNDLGVVGQAAGLEVTIDGSLVGLAADNASFYGVWGDRFVELPIRFFAVDDYGLVTLQASYSLVHILPKSPAEPTPLVDTRAGGSVSGDGRYWQQFHLPADAVVTSATVGLRSPMSAQELADLAARITITCNDDPLAEVTPAMLPARVALDTAVIAELQRTTVWHGVSFFEVSVTVESEGGAAVIAIDNLTVDFTRNPDVPLPDITGVTIDAPAPVVDAGQRFNLSVDLLPADPSYRVQWYVDGKLAAEGTRAYGLSLAGGDHLVEVWVSNESAMTVKSLDIYARSSAASGGTSWWQVAAGVAAVGVAFVATRRGRWVASGVCEVAQWVRHERAPPAGGSH